MEIIGIIFFLVVLWIAVGAVVTWFEIWAARETYRLTKSPEAAVLVCGLEGYAIAKLMEEREREANPAPARAPEVMDRAEAHRAKWSGRVIHDREADRNRRKMLGSPNHFSW